MSAIGVRLSRKSGLEGKEQHDRPQILSGLSDRNGSTYGQSSPSASCELGSLC